MKIDTFEKIERIENIAYCCNTESPLSLWYDNIRQKSLFLFSDGDLARTVRQELYLNYVMPYVVERLRKNILAGELYDGELLTSLCSIPNNFWQQHKMSYEEIRELVKSNYDIIKKGTTSETIYELDVFVKN